MQNSGSKRVEAIHPHWRGFIWLSAADNTLHHEQHHTKGTYLMSDNGLTVRWDGYSESDIFVDVSGTYIHERVLRNTPAAELMRHITLDGVAFAATRVSVRLPGHDYEVSLRLGTSDIPTFNQVFVRQEYASSHLPGAAQVIVDLGANIGLSAVFLGLRYRYARIVALEPDIANFAALATNVARLGRRVQCEHAAIWTRDGMINLHHSDADGALLGAWGVQVSERTSDKMTQCHRMETLLEKVGVDQVDILKVDIEGAELELFSDASSSSWLQRVRLLVIETHDRFRPGSDQAVRRAVASAFDELPSVAENLFFRRR